MENSQQQLRAIQNRVAAAGPDVTLIAVSKTFGATEIRPVLEAGQRVFGENRVQEAAAKWPELRLNYVGIQLHLIGPLQSKKAGDAVTLFDVIQTLDRPKIVVALAAECLKQNKVLQFYVQINTGAEPQKAGVLPQEADQFIDFCRNTNGLNVVGLMCIPPVADDPRPHFAMLRDIATRNGLTQLSMGMSADFEIAIAEGATAVRVGSAIFGSR